MPRRLKLTLAYDGTEFHGWQVQPGLPTIQGHLERVVGEIEGAPVKVEGSGRTDSGVHALAQTAAVTLENAIPPGNFQRAVNRLLPSSIRVLAVDEVPLEFHPRFHALAKTYEYRIWRGPICSPFERRYVHHHPYPLDESAMIAAARLLVGDHDFSSFAASDESDALGRSKVRTIYASILTLDGDRLLYRVRGSGFLKHMVRNLVGALIEVGKGNLDPAALRAKLDHPRLASAGPTAPAQGLFLVSVEYR